MDESSAFDARVLASDVDCPLFRMGDSDKNSGAPTPRYLIDVAQEFPDTALKVIFKHAQHLYHNAFDWLM